MSDSYIFMTSATTAVLMAKNCEGCPIKEMAVWKTMVKEELECSQTSNA